MKPANEREEVLFREALRKCAGPERNAFLGELCRGDDPLRARLEALLRAHEGGGWESPTESSDAPTLPIGGEERTGTTIGRYKLLEKIGEGGFGAVYVAEQREPVKRRVALKIIKLGMDTRQVVARFEAERQALAMMDHPNIAKVLDAGATDTGRPYFVMELVKGIPITQYCERAKLDTRGRLGLFINVCHAIQHAHQKGIIHRDIKPSNILVTLHDGLPVPKVIDFGIAKATQQELTEKTVYTQFQQFIGTPAYMSPEQAEMSGLDVDTRSDIYSLGVLLYELLTGTTPFDSKELLASGLDEMRKIIREREPVQPSTRLRQTASGKVLSRRRSAPSPGLSSDLDWIVMKCLEKDRTRRYDTANGLANDVLRHLQDEPVLARAPGKVYRFRKLVRRNKLAFAAAAAFTGALLIGLGLSTWLFFKEREARRLAMAAEETQSQLRQQAQAEAKKSEQVAQLLKSMLQGVGPSAARGRDTTMLREILDETSQRVGKGLKDQPEVEAEMRSTIGDVYSALGQYGKAENAYREALALRKALWGNNNTNVADTMDSLGRVLTYQGRLDDAEPLILGALTIRTNLLGAEHVKVAASLFHLAQIRFRLPAGKELETLIRQSLAIRRKCLGNESIEVVESLSGLSNILLAFGRAQEGETAAREALSILARLPGDARFARDADLGHISLGWLLYGQGKLEEAELALRQELEQDKSRMGPEHPEVARDLYRLGTLLVARSKLEEAENTARQAVALSRKALGDRHFYTFFSLQVLRDALVRSGRLPEAEALCREQLDLCRQKILPGSTPSVVQALAGILRQEGKTAEIPGLFREAVEISRKHLFSAGLARALGNLAEFLREQAKYAEAEPHYREALQIYRREATNEFGGKRWVASGLGIVLQKQGKFAEAEAAHREAIAAGRQSSNPEEVLWALIAFGDSLREQREYSKAEPVYREGLELCRSTATNTVSAQRPLARGLALALKNQDKMADAKAVCRKRLEIAKNSCTAQEFAADVMWTAAFFREAGDLAGAEAIYREGGDKSREAIEAARRSLAPGELARQLAWFGDLLREQNELNEAELVYREGCDLARSAGQADPEARQWLASGLGVVLRSQGKLPQAEAAYREAVTNCMQIWAGTPERWQWVASDLLDVLSRQGKTAEAEAVAAELRRVSKSEVDKVALLRVSTDLAARNGQWKEAADLLKKMVEFQPEDSFLHMQLAVVLLQSGDKEGYERQCRNMVARFNATKEATDVERTAKACLLVPRTGSELETASELARRGVALGTGSMWISLMHFCDGLAQYRRGEYAVSGESMRKVMTQRLPEVNFLFELERDMAAWSLLGMAEYQLKHEDAARSALAKAREIAETKVPPPGSEKLGRDWVDCLIGHIFLREAKSLIEGTSDATRSGVTGT